MKPPKIQLKRDISNPNIKGIYDYNNMTKIEQRLFFLRKEKKKNNNKNSKLKLNNTARNTQKNATNKDNYKTYFNSIQQAIICKAKENIIKNKSKGVINNYKGLRGSSSAINFFSPKKKIINPFNDTDNNLEKTKNLFTKRTNREDFCINNNEISNQNSTFLENRKKIIEKILQLNNPPNYDKQLKNVRINALKILKEMAMRDDDKHKKIFNMKEPEDQANFSGFYSNYEISDISGVHSKINNIKNKINKKEIIEDENLELFLQKKAKDTGDFLPSEFNPLTYKLYKCPLGPICKLDKKLCLNYHGNGDRRRNPNFYKAELCPNLFEKNKRKKDAKCPLNDDCDCAHNLFEYYYHPKKFRTVDCPQEKKGKYCKERLICPYLHESDSDCGKNGEKIILDKKLITDYYKSLIVSYEKAIDDENEKLNEIEKKYLCYKCGKKNTCALKRDDFTVDLNSNKIICGECINKYGLYNTAEVGW
jgi:hypothetical protein